MLPVYTLIEEAMAVAMQHSPEVARRFYQITVNYYIMLCSNICMSNMYAYTCRVRWKRRKQQSTSQGVWVVGR
jgi:hypothetical protein